MDLHEHQNWSMERWKSVHQDKLREEGKFVDTWVLADQVQPFIEILLLNGRGLFQEGKATWLPHRKNSSGVI